MPTGATGATFTQWRAGTATIAATTNSVTVTMSSAFTGSPTNYRVALSMTNAPNFGGGSGWGYLDVSGKTATTFVINLDTSAGANQAAPTGGVVVDWIAIPNN